MQKKGLNNKLLRWLYLFRKNMETIEDLAIKEIKHMAMLKGLIISDIEAKIALNKINYEIATRLVNGESQSKKIPTGLVSTHNNI